MLLMRFDTIWARIEHRMSVKGMTFSDLRKATGIGESTLRAIRDNPQSSPRIDNIGKIADALGTTEGWLARERGPEELGGNEILVLDDRGANLVRSSVKNAVTLTHLLARAIDAHPEVQSRLIGLMEAELGPGPTQVSPARQARSKSGG